MYTNKNNGKIYVGQTKRRPEERWSNGKGYRTCRAFNYAIKKYGWENFEHEVIASNLTKEEACHFEELLIRLLDTTNHEKGYNLLSGGETHTPNNEVRKKMFKSRSGKNNPRYGKHCSEETKKKISEANKGKFKGERNPMYGKSPSLETREKMSQAKKGRYSDAGHPQCRPVICIETGEVLYGAMGFEKKYGYNHGTIAACCRGKVKTHHGYHFEYYIEN